MANDLGISVCSKCVLPESFPGVAFDSDGVCNYCREAPALAEIEETVLRLRQELNSTVEANRGGRDYDCIVAYSGGKDSSYTLKYLVEELNLRCLAVTIDNGFMSDQARLNAQSVTTALGVDYLLFTPSWNFMSRMYRESLSNSDLHSKAAIKRASAVCNSCIGLVNAHMVRLALMHGANMIAGGYIGGQVPKDTAVLELNLNVYARSREATIERYEESFGKEAGKFFGIPEELVKSSERDSITILNPMLALNVGEDDIVSSLASLGWKPSLDTGKNSSNCRLNDLGIRVHYEKHGFNPYVFEISEQVRHGLMSREVALKKAFAIPSSAEVEWQAEKLELSVNATR